MIIGLSTEELEIYNVFINGGLSELNALIHLYESSNIEIVEMSEIDTEQEVRLSEPLEIKTETEAITGVN